MTGVMLYIDVHDMSNHLYTRILICTLMLFSNLLTEACGSERSVHRMTICPRNVVDLDSRDYQ